MAFCWGISGIFRFFVLLKLFLYSVLALIYYRKVYCSLISFLIFTFQSSVEYTFQPLAYEINGLIMEIKIRCFPPESCEKWTRERSNYQWTSGTLNKNSTIIHQKLDVTAALNNCAFILIWLPHFAKDVIAIFWNRCIILLQCPRATDCLFNQQSHNKYLLRRICYSLE